MNTKIKHLGLRLLAVIMLLALLLFPQPAKADNQGFAFTFLSLTNVPNTMTNTQFIAASNNIVPLRTYSGLGVQSLFVGSNLVTAPVTIVAYGSVDGTNLFTTPLATLTVAATGTNVVVSGTNWSQLTLKGYAAIGLSVSNGTGATITSGGLYTNSAGVIYPLGLDVNRPNQ